MQVTDISFDLETLSNRYDSTIVSIGAAEFNRHTGEIGRTLYLVLDLNDSMKHGHVDAGTLMWWMGQSDAARKVFLGAASKKVNLRDALDQVAEFVKRTPNGVSVWGNGSTFDITILEHAFSKVGRPVPWDFWNVRDMRTIVDVAYTTGFDKRSIEFNGVAHNAVDDAVHQAQVIAAAWNHVLAPAAVEA